MTNNLQLFNLKTMSGVFPGTRTQIFQRLRLFEAEKTESLRWAQLSWYDDPPACVLTDVDGAEPTLRIENPLEGDLLSALHTGLADVNGTLHACASCSFWHREKHGEKQREEEEEMARTIDGLPTGQCHWQPQGEGEQQRTVSAEIATQSGLALGCAHWAHGSADTATFAPDRAPSDAISEPPLQESILERVRGWFGVKPPKELANDAPISLTERSGVGAGTEPCFACNGRLANLGAMTVESTEGDKQTYSVWRCRSCYTFYLNRWIDRWERLDTLETVETHYRVAPAEALLALEQIGAKPGSEHPRLRAERADERTWFEQLIQNREPISHQVKQGR